MTTFRERLDEKVDGLAGSLVGRKVIISYVGKGETKGDNTSETETITGLERERVFFEQNRFSDFVGAFRGIAEMADGETGMIVYSNPNLHKTYKNNESPLPHGSRQAALRRGKFYPLPPR